MTVANDFANDLLSALGIPLSTNAVQSLIAWQGGEGTSARFNPLATTQPAPGDSLFNPVGVRNYPSYDVGLTATVQTLTNGLYGPILDGLKRPATVAEMEAIVAASPWGTSSFGPIDYPGAPSNARPAVPGPGPVPVAPATSANPYPLPAGAYYGPTSPDPNGHSGYFWTWDRTGIAWVQARLGISSDGLYGPQTTAAVIGWQRAHGLTVDGLVGPQTWGSMFP